MNDTILYLQNKATKNEIVEHLKKCDANFVPPLSQRVELNEYGTKIFNNAERFEAWSKETLVGMVAAYCNDPEHRLGYITSVSVLDELKGQGIVSRLMEECIGFVKSAGCQQLGLEVERDNTDAIRLYVKKGFVSDKVNGSVVTMHLDIGSGA